ncbi:MAG: excinuclease ABC subunit UvrA [Candidatus Omnitrophica bacterium]|nr:excinuclease ABC subunit UvrA [Candidatus Omnitrophota bacterium]
MNNEFITIKGAKEHNLKNVSIQIPRNQFVVVTGLSGSGKSSLAFDTIYAEGQRRYVESLSAYARQFLEQLQKPNIESIDGLSPTISIEQKTTSKNPRSTVATQTEINDYLRLLFARIGTAYCPNCGKKIERQHSQEIVEQLFSYKEGTKIVILAPLIRGRKGEYRKIASEVTKAGYSRLRVDGQIYTTEDEIKMDKFKVHNIEVVVDRITIKPETRKRLTDSIETALDAGKGLIIVSVEEQGKLADRIFSEHFACVDCGISIVEIEPRTFSFNSPYGACPTCNGLGTRMEIDPDILIPDETKPWINAIAPSKRGRRNYLMYYRAVMREIAGLHGFDPYTPYQDLKPAFKKIILHGSDDEIWGRQFEGILRYLERMFQDTDSEWLQDEISQYMSLKPCPSCGGARLKKESLAVRINDKNISEVSQLSIKEAKKFFQELKLTKDQQIISAQILKEIIRRLDFCINVGLDYLTLDRRSGTLSGGEAERIRLATQVGSGLVGVIYILDEPSIGLHQRDNDRLLSTLHALRDMGNSLIVVEHDEETIRRSDHVIDLGPGAGEFGGEIIFEGDVPALLKSETSLTGQYLSGKKFISTPATRRPIDPKKQLKILGAAEHNLKDINLSIPLGTFTCITGVSGSGKSTLVDDIIHKSLAQKFYGSKDQPGKVKKITGMEWIDKFIVVDQSPIGRTPRSNPATYTGVFDHIRNVFTMMPESKLRGYKPGRFSFNVKGGRCEACNGDGIKKIEMHFLPDVYVQCEVCGGRRFNDQTLEVQFKGKNINDILNTSVTEGLAIFENVPKIRRVLETLNDVGLGYIKLGQSATTLSGGEAQRVKLASELCKHSTGQTFYILDEPTTGLHFADVEKLLEVLQRLVGLGNTVLIIEHNLDVVKNADYIIDLGPEGGDRGGEVMATGTPEEVAQCPKSYTGQYLKKVLKVVRV